MMDKLSKELKQEIFNYLHPKDWSLIAQLSKQWSNLTKEFTTEYLKKASFDKFKEAFVSSVKKGNIALFRACVAADRLEDVKTIIQAEESNEDITEEELGSGSLLFRAVFLQKREIIQYLINAGASANGFGTYDEQFADKTQPLYAAWLVDNSAIAKFLISKGASTFISAGITNNLYDTGALDVFIAEAVTSAVKMLRDELAKSRQKIEELKTQNAELKAKLQSNSDISVQPNSGERKRKLDA